MAFLCGFLALLTSFRSTFLGNLPSFALTSAPIFSKNDRVFPAFRLFFAAGPADFRGFSTGISGKARTNCKNSPFAHTILQYRVAANSESAKNGETSVSPFSQKLFPWATHLTARIFEVIFVFSDEGGPAPTKEERAKSGQKVRCEAVRVQLSLPLSAVPSSAIAFLLSSLPCSA